MPFLLLRWSAGRGSGHETLPGGLQGTMSKASDVYALGMLLWELYVGQAVWPSLNFSQLHRRVVAAKEKPALPAEAPPALKVCAPLVLSGGVRPSGAL